MNYQDLEMKTADKPSDQSESNNNFQDNINIFLMCNTERPHEEAGIKVISSSFRPYILRGIDYIFF